MSIAKVTNSVDEIAPKDPNGLRVAFKKPAGNKTSLAISAINIWDYITKEMFLANVPASVSPFIYNIPAGSVTPIVINLNNDTIKFGPASAMAIGSDMSEYQANPDIKFEVITSALNTSPKPAEPWISNKLWFDNTYTSLVELTLQPDTDTGLPGGLTLDNINIIIKP